MVLNPLRKSDTGTCEKIKIGLFRLAKNLQPVPDYRSDHTVLRFLGANQDWSPRANFFAGSCP